MPANLSRKTRMEEKCLGDLCVDGNIILKWISRGEDVWTLKLVVQERDQLRALMKSVTNLRVP
jgi:hypothetical protein